VFFFDISRSPFDPSTKRIGLFFILLVCIYSSTKGALHPKEWVFRFIGLHLGSYYYFCSKTLLCVGCFYIFWFGGELIFCVFFVYLHLYLVCLRLLTFWFIFLCVFFACFCFKVYIFLVSGCCFFACFWLGVVFLGLSSQAMVKICLKIII